MKQLGTHRKLWTGGGPPGLLAAACLILLVVYLPTFSNPPHLTFRTSEGRFLSTQNI